MARRADGRLARRRRPPNPRPLCTELVCSPMVQMLEYLRANGYLAWIVCGGGVEFVRALSEPASMSSMRSWAPSKPIRCHRRRPDIDPHRRVKVIADRPGKPVGISPSIGRHPALAFGNSDGDSSVRSPPPVTAHAWASSCTMAAIAAGRLRPR